MYDKIMYYFLIFLSVISLAGIVYMAISRKSSLKHRVTALAALALMIITVIICLFQIFGPSASKVTYYPPDMPLSSMPESKGSNTGIIAVFIIFLLLLFILVLMLSIREHRHSKGGLPKEKKVDVWD